MIPEEVRAMKRFLTLLLSAVMLFTLLLIPGTALFSAMVKRNLHTRLFGR